MIYLKSYQRRLVALFVSMLVLLFCSGCNNHRVSFEQSRKNIAKYQEEIATVVNHDDSHVEVLDENLKLEEDGGVDLKLRYKVDNQTISVYLSNLYGYEDFGLYVRLDCFHINSYETGIDLERVVRLLDVFSGYDFTVEELSEIIHAPNGKYESYERLKDEVVSKYKPINFMEDWRVRYIIAEKPDSLKRDSDTADYYEELVVCGLTKR